MRFRVQMATAINTPVGTGEVGTGLLSVSGVFTTLPDFLLRTPIFDLDVRNNAPEGQIFPLGLSNEIKTSMRRAHGAAFTRLPSKSGTIPMIGKNEKHDYTCQCHWEALRLFFGTTAANEKNPHRFLRLLSQL